MLDDQRTLGTGCRLAMTLLVGLTAALVTVSSVVFIEQAWRRDLAAIVARLNDRDVADPASRRKDIEELRVFVRAHPSRLERMLTTADPRERDLARFAATVDPALAGEIAARRLGDVDESVAFQARLTLGERPEVIPLAPGPESKLAALVGATGDLKYGDDEFHELDGTFGTLELDGPGVSRIVLSYVWHGAHYRGERAFVFDRRGESVVARLEASNGSVRWVSWHGHPAAFISEIYCESCYDGASELVGVIAVRHTLLEWRGEGFEKRDTFYTTFVEKYP